jgi:hypothetical protein
MPDVAGKGTDVDLVLASASTGRHLQYAGLGLAFLGGVALVVAGVMGLQAAHNAAMRRNEKLAVVVGGVLLAIGFLIQAAGVHSH